VRIKDTVGGAPGRRGMLNPENDTAGEVGGMRVAVIVPADPDLDGDARDLVGGLVERGDAVTVYRPDPDGYDPAARVVPLELPPSAGPRDVAAITALRRTLREDPVDVVHAHGLRAGFVAALALRRTSTPLVVTWHNAILGSGVRARALRAGERVVARSADVTLGASGDLVARAVALGGRDVRSGPVAAPRLRPMTRTAEEVRAELGVGEDRPLVLSVGRLHPQKGYGVLVSAAARWRGLTPAPAVAIAGTGPAYRELAAQISEARAPVTLLGHRTDVAELLGAADLAVVSSVWEARQLFAQEALQAGVPLVATDVGGIPDLVGDAAVLVPAGDVDALDGAVRALLADPARRAELARSGRERAALWPTEADTVTLVGLFSVELRRRTRESAAAQARTRHVAPDPGGAG
jgi:glycosyltransferase involved in cell wall biosynthesis